MKLKVDVSKIWLMLFWFFSTASKFRKTTRNRVVGLTNIGFTFEFPINNKKNSEYTSTVWYIHCKNTFIFIQNSNLCGLFYILCILFIVMWLRRQDFNMELSLSLCPFYISTAHHHFLLLLFLKHLWNHSSSLLIPSHSRGKPARPKPRHLMSLLPLSTWLLSLVIPLILCVYF